ncbi:hypothetical protein GCM10009780_42460 [Actinomadura alba]
MVIVLGAGTVEYTAARSRAVPDPSSSVAAPARTPTPAPTPIPTPTPTPTLTSASTRRLSASERTRLTRDLDRYLDDRSGQVSASIRDLATGLTYGYNTRLRTAAASIVKVDILAALLLQAQRKKRRLTASERSLATRMIRVSDNGAAAELWNRIGGSSGLATANSRLGLRDTTPGPGGYWGSTTTSVADQIRILRALTSSDSPLSAAGRRYALGLMADVDSTQSWGVSAAAGDGDTTALKNGWLPRQRDGGRWTINSIGRVRGSGHDYLIAVLSKGNASMAEGVATVEHVAALVSRAVSEAVAP